ncbi:MAG: NAD-dependent epimerase/dehydratase family protein [Desulfobulbaceae bacterium]|nr:NAD-dependent epimerase/dehydratase family protein [Desulfobulbaceae bacterium]HIJ78785.1 NAD-dependent epimerase/dehydratase family protein [Deltaproteobacteria bacterium]
MKKILVTGATGQIGSELVPALRSRYGFANVIACGHQRTPPPELEQAGPYLKLDIRDPAALNQIVAEQRIDTIYHLAALLSAVAEQKPQLAWEINMGGLLNVLEAARLHHCAVFHPSSIGAFGPTTPAELTPQVTIQRPNTMYGVTKVAGELLCDYYFSRFQVDARGVRYPGLISYQTPPGGGTTDYAVEIFHAAVQDKPYRCFLKKGTRLDMMYMADAIEAAIAIMEAEPGSLSVRNAFNITAMSVAPEDIYHEIKKHRPGFTMTYEIDPIRQAIAESWPNRLDDSEARRQWGFSPRYDLAAMTKEMIAGLTGQDQEKN